MTTKEQQALIEKITTELAAKGKIIEGGWQAYLVVGIPPDAPELQKAEMRKAYYLGAQHLFASILGILDPGSEPTEKDMERMSMIHEELEAFAQSLPGFDQSTVTE